MATGHNVPPPAASLVPPSSPPPPTLPRRQLSTTSPTALPLPTPAPLPPSPESPAPSDHTPLLQQHPGSQLPENFRRSMKIIKSRGRHETTHRAQLLVDTDSEKNLIDLALVEHLRLESRRIKPPLRKRVFAKLFFWTKSAKDLKAGKLQSVDGSEVRGQDSEVTIRWSGDNNPRILDPVISFRPKTFTTTHLVVDGCVADVILSWEEARKQGLYTRCAGATGSRPKPPTADNSPNTWTDYDARKAQKEESRRQERGHAPGQPSDQSSPSGAQS